jgi:hypothetical protein
MKKSNLRVTVSPLVKGASLLLMFIGLNLIPATAVGAGDDFDQAFSKSTKSKQPAQPKITATTKVKAKPKVNASGSFDQAFTGYKASKKQQQTSTISKPKPKIISNVINLAPYTSISSSPYCGTLQYLIDGEVPKAKGGKMAEGGAFFEMSETQSDGNIATYTCFPTQSSKEEIIFKLAEPVKIDGISFFQRAAYCESYKITGDTTGNGNFDKLLLQRYETGQPGWNAELLPKDLPKLYAVKFAVIKAKGRGAPQIAEFQLLIKKNPVNKALAAKWQRQAAIASSKQELKFSAPVKFGANPRNVKKSDKYQFGAVGSLWMFLDQTRPYEDRGLNPTAMEALKDLTMDRVRLFIGLKPKSMAKVTIPKAEKYRKNIFHPKVQKHKRYAKIGSSCMPWPSKVLVGYQDNIIKRAAGDFKKNGLGLGIIPPRNLPPFDVRSGWYPMAQPDRHEQPDPRFPCVWHGGYWEPAFSQIIKEIVDSNVTSLDITPDEFYIENHNLQRMPKDDPCRKIFKKTYGIEVPKKVADNEDYRKWLLFGYNSTAGTFKSFVDSAKKANPAVITESNLSVAPLLVYNSPTFSLALDIVGHRSGIDLLGADPYFRADTLGHYQMPKTAALYQGATPTRKTVMMLQAVCGDFRTPFSNPVWAAGTATSILMRGVHDIDFYRFNYYANISPHGDQNPAYKFYKNWIKMVRALEPLGMKKATVPKDIAMLYARAGNDWWELKEKAESNFKNYPNSAMAGYAHHDAVMKMLFSNGRPFDLYYLDQPSTLKNILKYKVVIIPFAYSVSKAAYKILQTAQQQGVRILIVNHLGETNELGTAYPKPLLKTLIKLPGVKYMGKDLLVQGNDPKVQRELLADIDTLLGKDKSFFVNTYGKDVEVGMLKNSKNGNIFIPIVNWHNQPTVIDLGLKLPPGNYELLRYSLDGVSKSQLNGKQLLSAKALRNFNLKLAQHETIILVVTKK